MSDISQIQVNGTTYDLCDATSRTQIANLQDSVDSFEFYSVKQTITMSGSSNSSDDFIIPNDKGYALGVIGFQTGNWNFYPRRVSLKDGKSANVQMHNSATSSQTGEVRIDFLLWNKDIFLS